MPVVTPVAPSADSGQQMSKPQKAASTSTGSTNGAVIGSARIAATILPTSIREALGSQTGSASSLSGRLILTTQTGTLLIQGEQIRLPLPVLARLGLSLPTPGQSTSAPVILVAQPGGHMTIHVQGPIIHTATPSSSTVQHGRASLPTPTSTPAPAPNPSVQISTGLVGETLTGQILSQPTRITPNLQASFDPRSPLSLVSSPQGSSGSNAPSAPPAPLVTSGIGQLRLPLTTPSPPPAATPSSARGFTSPLPAGTLVSQTSTPQNLITTSGSHAPPWPSNTLLSIQVTSIQTPPSRSPLTTPSPSATLAPPTSSVSSRTPNTPAGIQPTTQSPTTTTPVTTTSNPNIGPAGQNPGQPTPVGHTPHSTTATSGSLFARAAPANLSSPAPSGQTVPTVSSPAVSPSPGATPQRTTASPAPPEQQSPSTVVTRPPTPGARSLPTTFISLGPLASSPTGRSTPIGPSILATSWGTVQVNKAIPHGTRIQAQIRPLSPPSTPSKPATSTNPSSPSAGRSTVEESARHLLSTLAASGSTALATQALPAINASSALALMLIFHALRGTMSPDTWARSMLGITKATRASTRETRTSTASNPIARAARQLFSSARQPRADQTIQTPDGWRTVLAPMILDGQVRSLALSVPDSADQDTTRSSSERLRRFHLSTHLHATGRIEFDGIVGTRVFDLRLRTHIPLDDQTQGAIRVRFTALSEALELTPHLVIDHTGGDHHKPSLHHPSTTTVA